MSRRRTLSRYKFARLTPEDTITPRWHAGKATEDCREIVLIPKATQGREEIDIATRLDENFDSETNTDLLFEAYRLVCLSKNKKSKQIGPHAIALLTANIILEGGQAAGIEESWFQVYETLSDMELISSQPTASKIASNGTGILVACNSEKVSGFNTVAWVGVRPPKGSGAGVIEYPAERARLVFNA